MDDLLQRMLAIDQEAEKLVETAETEAAAMLEEVRLQIAAEREKAQAELLKECDALLQEKIARSQLDAEAELNNLEQEITVRLKTFADGISRQKPEILRNLLLPS